MRMIGRVCLVVMVAISLVAAGMPFAHAMPTSAASTTVHDVHHHGAADHAIRDHAQHLADAAVQHHHDKSSAAADWLNGKTCCSMCATAYVAPGNGEAGVMRIGFPIRYWVLTALRPDAPAAIDPGIPIV